MNFDTIANGNRRAAERANKRTETLYFSLTNGDTLRVSLLMGKEIEEKNLLCDTFNLPQSYWPIFTMAFKAVNSEMALNGFAYDVKQTNGIVACASTKEALAELLEDIAFAGFGA